ncbi:hypothetical protein [Burkholderia anthina]|nr:hypothetical protein [Burkholderia anthina]
MSSHPDYSALKLRGARMIVTGTADAEPGFALEGLGHRPIECVYGTQP